MVEKLLGWIERMVPQRTIDPKQVKSVLVVDVNHLGDMLMSSPVYRALKENLPGVRVDWLGWDKCREVMAGNPYVDGRYSFSECPWWEAWKARRRKYDVVMQLNTSLKTNLLLWFIGRRWRLGYNYRHRGCLLNVRVPKRYRTARSGNRLYECLWLVEAVKKSGDPWFFASGYDESGGAPIIWTDWPPPSYRQPVYKPGIFRCDM